MSNADDLLTTAEVAAALDLTHDTVRTKCQRGDLDAEKGANGRWRIPESEIERVRDERWDRYAGTDRRVHPI